MMADITIELGPLNDSQKESLETYFENVARRPFKVSIGRDGLTMQDVSKEHLRAAASLYTLLQDTFS